MNSVSTQFCITSRLNHTLRRGGKLESVRIKVDEAVDEINLLKGLLRGVIVLSFAVGVGHPELRRKYTNFIAI